MNDRINAKHLQANLIDRMLQLVGSTENHAGSLLRKNGDTDGYDEVIEFTIELRNYLKGYK